MAQGATHGYVVHTPNTACSHDDSRKQPVSHLHKCSGASTAHSSVLRGVQRNTARGISECLGGLGYSSTPRGRHLAYLAVKVLSHVPDICISCLPYIAAPSQNQVFQQLCNQETPASASTGASHTAADSEVVFVNEAIFIQADQCVVTVATHKHR